METRAHYVLIGAFMLGGIFLAILFTLWLGSLEREYDEYEVVFRQKISGLQQGANVLFNGIRVGEVVDLRLDRDDPNRSLALVQVEKDSPVKTDTKVELELVGVTGLAVIQFNGGSAQAPLLKNVSPDDIPSLEADLSGIAAVLDSSGQIALNVQRIISQENAEALSRILQDVESLTDVLGDKENDIALMIDNLTVMTGAMRRSAEKLENTLAEVELAAKDARELIAGDAGVAARGLANTAEELDEMVSTLNDILEANRDAIDAFAQQGLSGSAQMVTNMNRLVGTMEAILLEFDRDPTRFLLGEGRPTAD